MKSITRLNISILTLMTLILSPPVFSETFINANPDYSSSGIAYTTSGIPSIKIGDIISFRRFLVAGLFEARNEERFNQFFLPNHNWRGVGRIEAEAFKRDIQSKKLSIAAYISHESAHPTMGIREPTTKAYELIYDDVYRRMMLNSISLSGSFNDSGVKTRFSVRCDYNFYFLSKNTPELAGSRLGIGNGFSSGVEYSYFLRPNICCYISIFDRFIFKARSTEAGNLYQGNGDSLMVVKIAYPIINQTNTIVLKTGVCFRGNTLNRTVGLYFSVLYGGIYGFVDSRDNRFKTSFGVEVSL